ncbi:hypothetical protein [Paractinoplanes atraurantiacus]|uniref:Uncharacterized protein n=1 Tax=Paractinoplanes atraurantiacus TaxID=1036182 RepID=A0A285IPC8_9ACTN|nr:hypothetical protein [Actinoplanes atraurantiacus]SNY49869.1 hypothetical protein SAMN05421748_110155 [Actinoplanes atraurantiacus]
MRFRRPWPLAARVAVGGVAAVVALVGLRLAVEDTADFSAPRKGELVGEASSADGRFEVRVLHWRAVLGEDGWDVVVRNSNGREAYAGCLYSENDGTYTGIEAVGDGTVRLATEEGPVTVGFDPATMRITSRIPVALCATYES